MPTTATQTHKKQKEHISSCWLELQKAKSKKQRQSLSRFKTSLSSPPLGREASIFYWHQEAVFSVFAKGGSIFSIDKIPLCGIDIWCHLVILAQYYLTHRNSQSFSPSLTCFTCNTCQLSLPLEMAKSALLRTHFFTPSHATIIIP